MMPRMVMAYAAVHKCMCITVVKPGMHRSFLRIASVHERLYACVCLRLCVCMSVCDFACVYICPQGY